MHTSIAALSHPQRELLHNEIHARPPEAVHAPRAIAHVVMWADGAEREASRAHLAALLERRACAAPDARATHWRADCGRFRVRWELHTEFVAWTFAAPLDAADFGQGEPAGALQVVPEDWLARLPGQCLCSLDLWVLDGRSFGDGELVPRVLQEGSLVASSVAGGHAEVFTDFALRPDGGSRMVLVAGSLSPRRLGRTVQRLLEMETYRMTALLGLPVARDVAAALAQAERDLADLAEAVCGAHRDDEPRLLDRLTRLAGQVESLYASTHARFSASSAYFELVGQRIRELRETRLAGMQTLGEFMERRLSPARSTCEWAVRRQNALSQRVSRTSSLLRTRVEIAQQHSSQQLLATMNRRQDMQLRLQATVEGLSVAAITYYVVGLVNHLAKGAQALGWPWSPEGTAASAIPIVALGVWWSIRRMHHRLFKEAH